MANAKLRPEANREAGEPQNDLLTLTLHSMPTYRANWHHMTLAKMLDRVATGDCRPRMVFLPPLRGKSELVSRRFPAYMLGRSLNLRLIAARLPYP